MCEIAQWALFNKMPENEVNSLKFPEIWSSVCHLLKNQCFQDVYSNKDLFNEVKKCLTSTLEYHFIKYNDFCWKMLKEMNQVLKDCIRNHISKVKTTPISNKRRGMLITFSKIFFHTLNRLDLFNISVLNQHLKA